MKTVKETFKNKRITSINYADVQNFISDLMKENLMVQFTM